MDSEVPFGVGCIAPEVIGATTLEEWEKAVADTLNTIPSIRDLELRDIDGFRPLPPSDERNTFEGMPLRGMLKFKVTIPFRVQEDVKPGKGLKGVEDFIVRTYFDRRHPVTFVVCEVVDEKILTPSHSLMVIREFLNVEVGKLKRDDVRLHRMGPSPFHADFFVAEGAAESQLSDGLLR